MGGTLGEQRSERKREWDAERRERERKRERGSRTVFLFFARVNNF